MQAPLVQVSVALQHGTPVEQLWLVAAHTATAAWQVPCVAPSGIPQAEPAQQSTSPVQVPPGAWQEVDVPEPPGPVQSAHLPLVQRPLQQAVPAVQAPPVSRQVDTGVTGVVPAEGRHAKNPLSPYLVQVSPEPVQQLVSEVPVQDAPNGVHADAPPPHFRIIPSLGSGAHAWPLQH